jgi:negative regulator of flagellin synthesis FlgM
MRIVGTPGFTPVAPSAAAPDAAAPQATTSAPASGPSPMASSVLQPALAALRELPDIDHAKVAALRVALARGEVPFDAGKLAGLIERFHGSSADGR